MIARKKQKRIYVIDNDRDVVDAIRAILERKGYAVGSPQDDQENIIAGATAFQPDAILLDPISTRLFASDLAMVQALKRSPATAHIPIVMLSALEAQEFPTHDGLQQPIDGFIPRPLTSASLLEQIQRVAA